MAVKQRPPQRVMTRADRERLGRMIHSLRTVGDPYGSYLGALEEHVEQASVVRPEQVDHGTVTMNSRLCLRDLETGDCQRWKLVYDADAQPLGEGVSVLSPLGAALLGARVGQVVQWQSPRGRRGPRRARIERIVFQPEAAGQFDL